jgi:hypothetical protein
VRTAGLVLTVIAFALVMILGAYWRWLGCPSGHTTCSSREGFGDPNDRDLTLGQPDRTGACAGFDRLLIGPRWIRIDAFSTSEPDAADWRSGLSLPLACLRRHRRRSARRQA